MDLKNYFIHFFQNILLYKKDIILFLITFSLVVFFRILAGILKRRYNLNKLFIRILNYFIILLLVEFLKDKVQGIWFLKIIFVLETTIIFLILKVIIIDFYINDYLLLKKKKKLSFIIVDIIKLIFVILFILVFLRNVFNVDLITILTPSAIMTAIIGLSMKDTIGNLISGLVIQIEKPFDLGDWIQIGDLIGKVEEINWRYTKIRTILDVFIIIPNNTISSENIINFSKPNREVEVEIEIGVSYDVPPVKVKRAIYDILNKSKYVLPNTEKKVLLKEYGSSSVNYKIIFGVKDFYYKRLAIDEIYSSIWYQFKERKIEIPFPIRTVIFKRGQSEIVPEDTIRALQHNEIFKDSRKDVLEFIAKFGNKLHYNNGDVVIKQGDIGDTMYIIISGSFEVIMGNKSVALLKSGDFFGEVALLTDLRRNATVVCRDTGEILEIDRMLFKLILEKDKKLRDIVYKKFSERMVKDITTQDKKDIDEKKTLFESLKRLCGFN